MIERIHIEQLSVPAHIGVTAAERKKAQTLGLNITLWPRSGTFNEKLEDTIDYAAVAKMVTSFVASADHQLIETLADNLATELTKHFALKRVEVEVRKFVLSDAAYVAVTALRE